MIKFNVTAKELESISTIAERAVSMANVEGVEYNMMEAVMDLSACHRNGCKLKLAELAVADDFNLAHDVFGIRRHINRQTGKLERCFLPRYADVKVIA